MELSCKADLLASGSTNKGWKLPSLLKVVHDVVRDVRLCKPMFVVVVVENVFSRACKQYFLCRMKQCSPGMGGAGNWHLN